MPLVVWVFVFMVSCQSSETEKTSKKQELSKQELDALLVEANKKYVKRESDEIDQYIKHRNWEMSTTGTGIRYMVTKTRGGTPALLNTVAEIKFKISLLDGTLCYSSEDLGNKQFFVGQDDVESGLHEVIQLLHEGDEATIVLPSHLAHGLHGDEAKIPPKSSVLYEIEVVSVSTH